MMLHNTGFFGTVVIPGSSEQWLAVFPSDTEMKSLINESGLASNQ